jgi:hypothetical protein
MRKKSYFFFFALFVSVNLWAGNFDEVVYGDEIVSEPVLLGFGSYKLLDVIANDQIRLLYEELRSLGTLEISVQKLSPTNDGETKTTRYTFVAWRQIAFTARKIAATLVVDRYSRTGIIDADPDYYRVVEFKKY